MPNVYRYQANGKWFWGIDVRVKTREGRKRVREREIATKEQAQARLAKVLADAYEGRAFDIQKSSTITVAQAWELYRPISERDNESWRADVSRAKHLLQHLGPRICSSLTQEDVDAYRTVRSSEKAFRGGRAPKARMVKGKLVEKKPAQPPSSGTLNRELETLKRIINYAVSCGKLPYNPIARVPKLEEAAPRSTILEDAAFAKLLAVVRSQERWLYIEPVLLVGFDTGMRKGEVLRLRRDQVDWRTGIVRLGSADTKTKKPRVVALQARTFAALKAVPVVLVDVEDQLGRRRKKASEFVFANPKTGKARTDFKTAWKTIRAEAGIPDVWVHDLRHSFCTLARRRGLAESVVMQSSGHKTRAVFDRYNLVDESDAVEVARVMEVARKAQEAAEAAKSAQAGSVHGDTREPGTTQKVGHDLAKVDPEKENP